MPDEMTSPKDGGPNEWRAAVIDRLTASSLLNDDNTDNPQLALLDIVEWERTLAEEPAASKRDALRYQWIKQQTNLCLQTTKAMWIREDGERYYPSHDLAVNGVGFHGIEHLDELIDRAMEMFPVDGDGTPQC